MGRSPALRMANPLSLSEDPTRFGVSLSTYARVCAAMGDGAAARDALASVGVSPEVWPWADDAFATLLASTPAAAAAFARALEGAQLTAPRALPPFDQDAAAYAALLAHQEQSPDPDGVLERAGLGPGDVVRLRVGWAGRRSELEALARGPLPPLPRAQPGPLLPAAPVAPAPVTPPARAPAPPAFASRGTEPPGPPPAAPGPGGAPAALVAPPFVAPPIIGGNTAGRPPFADFSEDGGTVPAAARYTAEALPFGSAGSGLPFAARPSELEPARWSDATQDPASGPAKPVLPFRAGPPTLPEAPPRPPKPRDDDEDPLGSTMAFSSPAGPALPFGPGGHGLPPAGPRAAAPPSSATPPRAPPPVPPRTPPPVPPRTPPPVPSSAGRAAPPPPSSAPRTSDDYDPLNSTVAGAAPQLSAAKALPFQGRSAPLPPPPASQRGAGLPFAAPGALAPPPLRAAPTLTVGSTLPVDEGVGTLPLQPSVLQRPPGPPSIAPDLTPEQYGRLCAELHVYPQTPPLEIARRHGLGSEAMLRASHATFQTRLKASQDDYAKYQAAYWARRAELGAR